MSPKPLYRQIYEKFQLGPASHMTHIGNLGDIVAGGAIQTFNWVQGRSYRNLSNPDVQSGRARIMVPSSGRPLHDYVPLYFGRLTPMVAVNQDKNEELIFLRFSLEVLSLPGAVITDGNARSAATRFYPFQSIEDLTHLDARAINTSKYAADPEVKRKKQAEILIPDCLPIEQLLDIVCHSAGGRTRVLEVLKHYGMTFEVVVNPAWYFHTPAPERAT